jgi:hypothetical protein
MHTFKTLTLEEASIALGHASGGNGEQDIAACEAGIAAFMRHIGKGRPDSHFGESK